MSILVENLSKRFGNFHAIDHVYLEIKTGCLAALIGPSGSGKSTLLRLLAGLEKPDQGRIWFAGKDATLLSIQEREIGFVFQNYALFQHMTVYENIAFGLDIRNMSSFLISKKVQDLLQTMELEKFADRYPAQLSGGQRQRVALARAAVIEPKILLLDEPFAALDVKIKKQLRKWLLDLHKQASVTTVFITHDHQEALQIAHEVIILENGRVKYMGNPKDVSLYLSYKN